MNRRIQALALLVAATLLSAASPAHAWLTYVCGNGKLQKGLQYDVPLWEVVDGAADPWFMDVVGDVFELMGVQGTHTRFTSYDDYSSIRGQDWYVYQIILYPRNTGPLDGPGSDIYNGAAAMTWRSCSSGGGIRGASVYLDETLSHSMVSETNGGSTLRGVLAHELGHVLGMEHEDDFIAAMNSHTPVPKSGVRDRYGADAERGGERLWADETSFIGEFHRDTSHFTNEDPAVSPWTWDFFSGRNDLIYPVGGTTLSRCHGETADVQYTTANFGLIDVVDLPVRIVLSSNETISTSDITVRTSTFTRSVGNSGVHTKTLTIPPLGSIGQGTYYVGVILDPSNELSESDEYNNAAKTGLKINIPPSCFP